MPGAFSEADVHAIVSEATEIGPPLAGGQKTVFSIKIRGVKYALKLIDAGAVSESTESRQSEPRPILTGIARAKREVAILRRCTLPQIVRLGPVGLGQARLGPRLVVYYSEEWVEGQDLTSYLQQNGPLPPRELVRLGLDMNEAIRFLWSEHEIHRDIKPGNIMRRPEGAGFVLLDLGLAYDTLDVSLTDPGVVVGTLPYFSPEQLDLGRKRYLDCRSDMYSLGVVLFEAATGSHPYFRPGMAQEHLVDCIMHARPASLSTLRRDFPEPLSQVIARLLAKSPHLRFRTCDQLAAALRMVEPTGT